MVAHRHAARVGPVLMGAGSAEYWSLSLELRVPVPGDLTTDRPFTSPARGYFNKLSVPLQMPRVCFLHVKNIAMVYLQNLEGQIKALRESGTALAWQSIRYIIHVTT